MTIDNPLIFFFSALGAFNGLLLSLYFLFFARPKHHSNYLLGGLLAALSIRIGKSVFFYFNPELSKIFLQIGLSSCFLIGPFLYFYANSKVNIDKKSNPFWFLPVLVIILFTLIIGIIYPYPEYPTLWGQTFIKIIYYQWLLCIIATAVLLRDKFKILIHTTRALSYNDSWVLTVFLAYH